MLETMRNLAKTFVAKIMLGLLVLAFGVWGISGIAGSAFDSALSLTGWGPKDMAKVGPITINGDQYTRNLQLALKRMAQQTGQGLTLDDARRLGLNQQVLDGMIADAAITATASKLKLAVPQQQIINELASEHGFQDATGKFDPNAFHAALANNNMSEEQYFASQTQMRLQGAVLNTASGQLALPKTLSEAITQYEGETRDVKYFDVTASEADVPKPSDADLEAQYKKTPDAYTAPEYRTAATMAVSAADLAANQTITPEELEAGYERHKLEYATAEKRSIVQLTFPSIEAAQKAKDRIAGGEDIVKIASEIGLKEADITLNNKLRQDFLDPKIGDAAFALKEGEVSAPVQGALAIALLKASNVEPAMQPTFEQVKDNLNHSLQLEKAKAQLQSVYNAVEDARGKSEAFEEISKEQHLNLTLVPPVSASGQSQDGKDLSGTLVPDALKAIFASDVGVENDAIGTADGYVWYDVRSVIPSALKPLDQVRAQVSQDVVNVRIRDAAIAKAKAVVATLKSDKTIDAAAQDSGAIAKIAAGLKRNQQTADFDGPAQYAAFSVQDQGFATSAGGDGKSARVMQVIKVVMPAVMASSPELQKAKDQVKSAFAADLQADLVTALKKSVGVKINEALWKQNTGGEAPPTE